MKVLLVHKDNLIKCPPVISSLLILSDLGHEVSLVTEGINDYWKNVLEQKNINVHVIPNQFKGKFGALGKFLSYYNFRKSFFKIANSVVKNFNQDIVWVEGAQTIVSLGKRLKKYRYILQIQELHENVPHQLRAISKVIHDACAVFMPEYNRCVLYQCWFNLKKRPIVLPNKPYFIPPYEELDLISDKYKQYLDVFKNKKVILYQGHIGEGRDLSKFISAVKQLPQYQLVLMGKNHGILEKYKQINPNIVHIDFIPAPDYLLFTSYCHIGLVSYDTNILNNAYCAPNKIYEYTAYGKPIIGNNIPGLKVLENYKAGILVDENDENSILSALSRLEESYMTYSNGALKLFVDTDNKKTIKSTIGDLQYLDS